MVKYPPVTLGTAASTNTPGTYFCSVAAIMLLAVMGRVTRAQFLDAVEVPTTQATPLRLNLALPRTLRAIPLVLGAWTPTPSMVSPNTPAPFSVASPYTAEPNPAVWPHTPMLQGPCLARPAADGLWHGRVRSSRDSDGHDLRIPGKGIPLGWLRAAGQGDGAGPWRAVEEDERNRFPIDAVRSAQCLVEVTAGAEATRQVGLLG